MLSRSTSVWRLYVCPMICHWRVSALCVSCLYLNCVISMMSRETICSMRKWGKESHCDWLLIKSNKPCRINSPGDCHSIEIHIYPNKQIKVYAFGSNFEQPAVSPALHSREKSFSLLDMDVYIYLHFILNAVHKVKPLKLNNDINCLCKYLKTCYRNGMEINISLWGCWNPPHDSHRRRTFSIFGLSHRIVPLFIYIPTVNEHLRPIEFNLESDSRKWNDEVCWRRFFVTHMRPAVISSKRINSVFCNGIGQQKMKSERNGNQCGAIVRRERDSARDREMEKDGLVYYRKTIGHSFIVIGTDYVAKSMWVHKCHR